MPYHSEVSTRRLPPAPVTGRTCEWDAAACRGIEESEQQRLPEQEWPRRRRRSGALPLCQAEQERTQHYRTRPLRTTSKSQDRTFVGRRFQAEAEACSSPRTCLKPWTEH